MATEQREHKLAPNVSNTLNSVRSLLRKYVFARVLLMVVGWWLLVYWLGGLLDYLPVTAGSNETPAWVRIALLVTMVAGSLWAILLWGLPRLLRPIQDRSLALLIERHYPELNNELVTVVETNQPAVRAGIDGEISNPVAYRQMLEQIHRSVEARIKIVQPSTLFNWQPIWGIGVAVVFGLVVTLIAAIGIPDWLELWSKRLFALSNETWPRRAELRADGVQLLLPAFSGQLAAERVVLPFHDGIVRIPTGAAMMLQISANAATKQVPEVCTLFYRSPDGNRGRANLRRTGSPAQGWQQFSLDGPPLDGVSANMTLDVLGLDARLRDLQLLLVKPVVITDMKLKCIYPKYLGSSLGRPEDEIIQYRSGIKIPQGTIVTLLGQSSAPLRAVQFVVHSPDTQPEGQSTPSIRASQPNDREFSVELGVLESTQVVEVRLLDEHGLSSEQIPKYVVGMQEDTVPEVVSRLVGIGSAVTPNALLPISGTILDDHGVSKVQAELVRGDNTAFNLPLNATDDGKLDAQLDLQQLAERGQFSVAAGDTFRLVISARDFFDLNQAEHVGRGQPQQLAVVTPDELLIMLDRQELELRQRLELIVSELEQLRDVLQQLSSSGSHANSSLRRPAVKPWVDLREQRLVSTNNLDHQDAQAADDAQQNRMVVLRAQQSVLQADKSQQELSSLALRVQNIRQQLQNNRIDSFDRQARLQDKVYLPLVDLLDTEYRKLSVEMAGLQSAVLSGDVSERCKSSRGLLDVVLVKLGEIQASLLDIESYNEIIDLVRGLLDDQKQLLETTESTQRARILELLNPDSFKNP